MDDPEHRNGHWPAGFRPKENAFYVALPYGEFTDADLLKTSARRIPWYRSGLSPLLKNPLGADQTERILLLCAMAGRRTVP